MTTRRAMLAAATLGLAPMPLMAQQGRAVTRVFSSHPGHAAQHVDGALRHVTHIPEGRRHYI